MMTGKGLEQGYISIKEVIQFSSEALSSVDLHDKRVLVIIPDHTRTAPIGLFFKIIFNLIGKKVKKLDYLIALGTHPPLSEEGILNLVGISKRERKTKYSKINFFNHRWDDPESLEIIGTISADEIYQITNGLLAEDVNVKINKHVFDYELLIIIGPVVPHEVAGFSGGNKYLFPGISGGEITGFFHWLGALITNIEINGKKETPVRKVFDRASSFLTIPKLCFSLVVKDSKLSGLFIGTPGETHSKAVLLSSKLHIINKEKPYQKVLGLAPKMYDDLWTAAKVMYKLEGIVADGGELIIYAPHITEVSYTHGEILDKIGYHVRDYYLKQMDKFSNIPRLLKAHSSILKGIGTFENGIEKSRINVVLATRIPEERCKKINLGYKDPGTIKLSEWEGKEDKGILLVHNAGETLYRLE